jgi:3-oxoacyl-[acyl-carrier-protein] synthase III
MPKFWYDKRKLKVLGMGTALPGPPVSTTQLLTRIEKRFGVDVSRRGTALADRLRIATRHICRDFESRHEAPRKGDSNPDLAAAAVRIALDEAQLKVDDVDSFRRTSRWWRTVSALVARIWNCVRPVPASQTPS